MLFAFAYLLLRWLFQLVTRSSNDLTRDVEVVVLRHQLMVLRRQVGRPHLRRRDRLFMAALSRALPRARWSSSFVVTPETLLRTGTGSWCGGSGPTNASRWVAGHRSRMRFESSSCGWEGITPGGDASGSGASSPSSASGCRQRRSARSCGGLDSARLLAVAAPRGASSCEPRPRGSWRLTSLLSKRSCSGPCTRCSGSSLGPGGCTSWASPGTRTPHG